MRWRFCCTRELLNTRRNGIWSILYFSPQLTHLSRIRRDPFLSFPNHVPLVAALQMSDGWFRRVEGVTEGGQEIALINPRKAIPVINSNGPLENRQILQLKALGRATTKHGAFYFLHNVLLCSGCVLCGLDSSVLFRGFHCVYGAEKVENSLWEFNRSRRLC